MAAAEASAPKDSPRPLIRPEDLTAPGWTQLPPPAPLLPPVPFVVSQNFSKDLATWRAPELQLGPLGHGISDLAPQGTVTAVAVVDPEPLVHLDVAEASADKATLPLAHAGTGRPGVTSEEVALTFGAPPHGPDIRPSQGAAAFTAQPSTGGHAGPGTRSVPQTPADVGRPAPQGSEAMPVARSIPSVPAGVAPASVRDTGAPHPSPAGTTPAPVGDTEAPHPSPAATTPAPARDTGATQSGTASTTRAQVPVATTAAAPVTRPLVESPVPPQLPLIQLKTASLPMPIPAGVPSGPSAEYPEIAEADATAVVAPLVGDRPPLEKSSNDPAADTPGAAAGAPAGASSQGGTDAVAAMDLAQQPQSPRSDHLQRPAATGTPLVVGQSGRTPQATPTTADAPRRSGLGAPLPDLPPTAASLDVASLVASHTRRLRSANPAAQMPLAALAAAKGPAGPAGGAPAASLTAARPAVVSAPPTYAETFSLPVVIPEPERLDTSPRDGSFSLPPAPQATVALAPFQAVQPPAERRAPAPDREGRAVKALIGQRHGVDLDDVAVDRSPASAAKARAAGAAAFTNEGRVVIPKSYGTLDAGRGQALLAHELTHAAQQRKIGPRALPAENSSAGRALEAEAVGAELVYAAPALSTGKLGSAPAASGRPASGGANATVPTTPTAQTATGLPVARSAPTSVDDAALTAALRRLGAVTASPVAPLGGPVVTPQPGGFVATPQSAPAPVAASPIQRAEDDDRNMFVAPADPVQISLDSLNMDELATRLYPLINFKIRADLWDDRQRAGLLTGLYRR